MAVVDSCCFKCSTKTGSVIIGALLLIFCVGFLIVTIGLVAAWEDFDTQFLDDRLSRFLLKNSNLKLFEAYFLSRD